MKFIKHLSFTPAATYDTDAQSFITASGITNSTQKSAVNQLVLDLKSNGLWSKMIAVYPLVGGTYSTCKYNLKDPRDLDSAYRLVEISGFAISYSALGVYQTGIGCNLDTKLVPQTALDPNSCSISVYIRQPFPNINGVGFGDGDPGVFIGKRLGGSTLQLAIGGSYGSAATGDSNTGTSPQGFITGGTNGSRLTKVWANGIKGTDGTGYQSPLGASSIKILNPNGQYPNVYYCFVHIGLGLTDSEHQSLYTIVRTFQTSLGRNV
jgi:hypothetical protein